jgi:hypothetical protein
MNMDSAMYRRPVYSLLVERIREPRRFIQVLIGPRQTGKTTLAHQLLEGTGLPGHYASADEPALRDLQWIEQQWEAARIKAKSEGEYGKTVLVLDEIQKITGWSETVKRLWDEDTRFCRPLVVILLGSSSLLVQKGLTESLAGRFELIRVTHWTFREMKEAFGWDLDRYVFFGGYPGAAGLIGDHQRWCRYVLDSLVETVISRDILLMKRVDKPALLRRLFELGCTYSGQILSYQKMLGQLREAGNTTTLAHYLNLLETAGMLIGLPKYSGRRLRVRASSPKLQVMNTALMTAQSLLTFEEARGNPEFWGRLVESTVGASLTNTIKGTRVDLYYWLDRSREVDFVLNRGDSLVAIEVKSRRKKVNLPGIDAFSKRYPVKRKLLVGEQGINLEEFLQIVPEELF